MMKYLIKRYLLEKAYDEGFFHNTFRFKEINFEDIMFEKLKNGKIEFNQKEFKEWLEKFKNRREKFSLFLFDKGLLDSKFHVTEISESYTTSSIRNMYINVDFIISQAGEGCFSKPYNGPINGHLVINGIYDNQLIYLARKQKDFSIGYCGPKDSKYTDRIINYYLKMKDFIPFLFDNNETMFFEEEDKKDKIILLHSK